MRPDARLTREHAIQAHKYHPPTKKAPKRHTTPKETHMELLNTLEKLMEAFDPITGARNRLIRDGWTPEGAERLILATMEAARQQNPGDDQ